MLIIVQFSPSVPSAAKKYRCILRNTERSFGCCLACMRKSLDNTPSKHEGSSATSPPADASSAVCIPRSNPTAEIEPSLRFKFVECSEREACFCENDHERTTTNMYETFERLCSFCMLRDRKTTKNRTRR